MASLDARPIGVQWMILAALSIIFVAVLELMRLPAALMLGTMVAAILVAAADGRVRVTRIPFILAQGVIGVMIARGMPASIIQEIAADWPLFLAAVFSVVAASALLGWLLARWRVLPGSTAVWGAFPGAATAMVLMAEAYGADMRLVALMQYLRVVFVASTASMVASVWAVGGAPGAAPQWFAPIAPLPFAETLALAVFGSLFALRLRVPAGSLLLPLVLGALLQDTKLMTIDLPPWLLAASYAVIGWSIGLRFTQTIFVYAARALPRILAAIAVLVVICAIFGLILAKAAHVDPLTAYLATSPGGADSVAIIAASSKVDVPFVMALQTARFIVVLLVGPSLARFIAKRTGSVASQ